MTVNWKGEKKQPSCVQYCTVGVPNVLLIILLKTVDSRVSRVRARVGRVGNTCCSRTFTLGARVGRWTGYTYRNNIIPAGGVLVNLSRVSCKIIIVSDRPNRGTGLRSDTVEFISHYVTGVTACTSAEYVNFFHSRKKSKRTLRLV